MFCEKCGKDLFDEAVVCPNCGCVTKNYVKTQENHNILQNNNYSHSHKPTMSDEEASHFIDKEAEKVKKLTYSEFIITFPFIGKLLEMPDDYYPFLFILPAIVVIIMFALCFNEFSNLNKIYVSDKSLIEKLRKLKLTCISLPIIETFALICVTVFLFLASR